MNNELLQTVKDCMGYVAPSYDLATFILEKSDMNKYIYIYIYIYIYTCYHVARIVVGLRLESRRLIFGNAVFLFYNIERVEKLIDNSVY